ncbi:hypothetical protein BJN34_34115 [Cupriavidus necator]|uniref:Flagellar protein FlaG n=1 Tax=Cupriavidus necator TaxID=106590 RepID=A0A1U9V1S0_CUPNE|nr:flagellar protein FlaG [Cupriavidus necator]AQV98918.1 hypothetical protein BJN34_34115 [Cupriavidus necator]
MADLKPISSVVFTTAPTAQPAVVAVPVAAADAAPPVAPEKRFTRPESRSDALETARKYLSEVLRNTSYSVEFEIDDVSHRVITKIVDKTSGEVIRQIPTEQAAKLADAMQQLQGLFLNHAA